MNDTTKADAAKLALAEYRRALSEIKIDHETWVELYESRQEMERRTIEFENDKIKKREYQREYRARKLREAYEAGALDARMARREERHEAALQTRAQTGPKGRRARHRAKSEAYKAQAARWQKKRREKDKDRGKLGEERLAQTEAEIAAGTFQPKGLSLSEDGTAYIADKPREFMDPNTEAFREAIRRDLADIEKGPSRRDINGNRNTGTLEREPGNR